MAKGQDTKRKKKANIKTNLDFPLDLLKYYFFNLIFKTM